VADLRGGAPGQDPLDVQDPRDDGGRVAGEGGARRREVRDELRPPLRPHRLDVPGVDGLGVHPHGTAGHLGEHAALGGAHHPRQRDSGGEGHLLEGRVEFGLGGVDR